MYHYLNKNAQSQHGEHELHKDSCSNLPKPKNRILIGNFSSDEQALNAAKLLHPLWLIDGCKLCCPSIHKL